MFETCCAYYVLWTWPWKAMFVSSDSWLCERGNTCKYVRLHNQLHLRGAQCFKAKMFVIFITWYLMDHSVHVAKHVTVLACWNGPAWSSVTVWSCAVVSFRPEWCSCHCAVGKAYRAGEAQFHSFLTSALDGCEWCVSHSGPLVPGENIIVTCCLRGCMGLGFVVDVSKRDKRLLACGV
jgi:hypothetical protein